MSALQKGDCVTVQMLYNHVFPWQAGPSFKATLLHTPQGPGDCYTVRTDDGQVVDLNANSGLFVAMYKDAPQEEKEG